MDIKAICRIASTAMILAWAALGIQPAIDEARLRGLEPHIAEHGPSDAQPATEAAEHAPTYASGAVASGAIIVPPATCLIRAHRPSAVLTRPSSVAPVTKVGMLASPSSVQP